MTSTQIKDNINADITSKTTPNSISRSDVSTNLVDIVDYVDQEAQGYKVYSALISQSGTSAPTAKVLKNNLGVTFSFSRSSAGNYLITASSDVFTVDKTAVSYSINTNGSFSNSRMYLYSIGAQFFTLETYNATTATDGVITDSFIEIRVYN
jgi:hypothetical protein